MLLALALAALYIVLTNVFEDGFICLYTLSKHIMLVYIAVSFYYHSKKECNLYEV